MYITFLIIDYKDATRFAQPITLFLICFIEVFRNYDTKSPTAFERRE